MDFEQIKRRAAEVAGQVSSHPRVRQATATAGEVGSQLRTEFDMVRRALRAQLAMEIEDDTAELKRRLDRVRDEGGAAS